MKQSTWIWIAFVAAALIIAGVLIYASKGSEMENALSQNTTAAADTNTSSVGNTSKTGSTVGMKSTLGGIFDETGNYQCDYDQVSAQSRSTNVIYISNGKLRGEFRTITPALSTNSIFLYDGSYLYSWTEGKSTGKVAQPKTIKDLPSLIPEDITSGRILGSGLNSVGWNCHAWSLDKSKLVKPAYVVFN